MLIREHSPFFTILSILSAHGRALKPALAARHRLLSLYLSILSAHGRALKQVPEDKEGIGTAPFNTFGSR